MSTSCPATRVLMDRQMVVLVVSIESELRRSAWSPELGWWRRIDGES
jgi:hypothetical protein